MAEQKSIILINGPNLNMLGVREQSIYGNVTLQDIELELRELAAQENILLECFQSNHEGEIIDKIHAAYKKFDFIIINAGAYTHYSIAIHDALKAVHIPFIEVHLSNVYARESFRSHSVLSPIASGIIAGFGSRVYKMALEAACEMVKKDK